ncbi:MAG: RsmE family RNA methyltransferase [Planctomycetia bacterium]
MSERFFVATPPHAGRAELHGDEARHLARVLRAAVGDEVRLFAGNGVEWPARVLRIGRDTVELETGTAIPDPARSGPAVTIAVALPKGERQKWLVEKITELGVERLIPLATTRGVAEATGAARARLERTVIEACKQCGRNRLLDVATPRSVTDLLAGAPADARLLIADPHGMPLDATVAAHGAAAILGLVGPEGGFTADELSAATGAGGTPVSLGQHVLRVETAAVALAARLAYYREQNLVDTPRR